MSPNIPENLINTKTLVERQLSLWPEHASFIAKSFAERTEEALALTEETATQIVSLIEPRIDDYCRGYRWMCEAILEEELFFRRHGRYQATSFEDVFAAIYNDSQTMTLYMGGLLLSQVFWRNHVDLMGFYKQYLRGLPQDYSHLEIGPGHGLLLSHAALDEKCITAAAWDVSDASLSATQHCLERMKITTPINLEKRDIYADPPYSGTFDSIVVSEVLEHLEDPATAVQRIKSLLSARGRAYISAPCNSPAPDHIYLYKTPDDFFSQLEDAGLVITERLVTPSTGWTMERALRDGLSISCAAIVSN